jgi:hypothetical protein
MTRLLRGGATPRRGFARELSRVELGQVLQESIARRERSRGRGHSPITCAAGNPSIPPDRGALPGLPDAQPGARRPLTTFNV